MIWYFKTAFGFAGIAGFLMVFLESMYNVVHVSMISVNLSMKVDIHTCNISQAPHDLIVHGHRICKE